MQHETQITNTRKSFSLTGADTVNGGFQNVLESNFPCRFFFSTAHSSICSLVLVYVCVCLLVCVGAELHEWGLFSFSWSEAVKQVYSSGDFSPCRSTMLLLWTQDNWLLMTHTLSNQLRQWALQRENYSLYEFIIQIWYWIWPELSRTRPGHISPHD